MQTTYCVCSKYWRQRFGKYNVRLLFDAQQLICKIHCFFFLPFLFPSALSVQTKTRSFFFFFVVFFFFFLAIERSEVYVRMDIPLFIFFFLKMFFGGLVFCLHRTNDLSLKNGNFFFWFYLFFAIRHSCT